MDVSTYFSNQFSKWKANRLQRSLRVAQGVDFCSNDYLGLANNSELKRNILSRLESLPVGSGGSRLLRGHSEYVEEVERHLAEFSQSESCLVFGSGYQANVGFFSALLKEEAQVFSDEKIHASIIDGIRLAGCKKHIWRHNDLGSLESQLHEHAKPNLLNVIVCESLYSMDGDFAPLLEISNLAKNYGCVLVVDEAHSTGLWGPKGSGRVNALGLRDKVLATIHTGGKALGGSGAWVATTKDCHLFLVNKSRSFIYSTAPSFPQLAILDESASFLEKNFENLSGRFFSGLISFQDKFLSDFSHSHLPLKGLGGPITSLVLGRNDVALQFSEKLMEEGFDVRAIRFPTVPENQALLRMTYSLDRTSQEVSSLVEALSNVAEELL